MIDFQAMVMTRLEDGSVRAESFPEYIALEPRVCAQSDPTILETLIIMRCANGIAVYKVIGEEVYKGEQILLHAQRMQLELISG